MYGKCNEPISPVPWHFVKSRPSTATRRKHSTNGPNLFLFLKSMSTQTDRYSPLTRKSNYYDEQKKYKSNCVCTRLDLRRCYTRQFFLQLVPNFVAPLQDKLYWQATLLSETPLRKAGKNSLQRCEDRCGK